MKVSPDGHNVSVDTQADEHGDDAIAQLARTSDGHLTQLASPDDRINSGNDYETIGLGLGGGALAISPDDTRVYVIGAVGLAELARTRFQRMTQPRRASA